jgi:hypothetical protein
VEPEETLIARQRLDKHIPAAMKTQATIEELFETVFSVGPAPRLYNEDPRAAEGILEKRWQLDICQLSVEIVDKRSARAAVTKT